jgi:hypothetical protein
MLLDQTFMPSVAQALTEISRAAILPNDSIADRFASLAIPHNCCFALIRDANSSDVSRPQMSTIQNFQSNRDLRRHNLLGIVLNPSRLRKYLLELALGNTSNRAVLIKQDGP